MLGVKRHDTLSGGSGGGLDADAVLQGLAHQSVRIGLSQVRLGKERKLVQIVDGLDVLRRHALLLHLLPVIRDVVPDMLHLLHDLFILDLFDLFP